MFACPNCTHAVGEYPEHGRLAVVCSRCGFKYEVVGGEVVGFSSRLVTDAPARTNQAPITSREFELRVRLDARTIERFAFATSRDDEWITLRPGDRAAIVCSLRGEAREELLFIVNRTVGERFVIAKPGQRARGRALVGGGVAGLAVGGVALAAAMPIWFAAGAAVLVGVGARKVLAHLLRPVHALATGERQALEVRQGLLDEKRRMLDRRADVVAAIDRRGESQQRLLALRTRMAAVGGEVYAARIAAVDGALRMLGDQRAVDERLVRAYDRSLDIIGIEYDATATVDALALDDGSVLAERMAELREVEAHHAQLTRELEANAEVEKLLRG